MPADPHNAIVLLTKIHTHGGCCRLCMFLNMSHSMGQRQEMTEAYRDADALHAQLAIPPLEKLPLASHGAAIS